MHITATAPTRIDLAGGTLDIFPLYLFEGGGLTINMAISLRSRVELETRTDGRYSIRSEDLDLLQEAQSADSLPLEGPLSLINRVVRFFKPSCGLNITTRNTAPQGSGLGASSSLLIALCGALGKLNNEEPPRHELVDWAANLEAQVLGIPTGKQDYYAALCGGLNAIWFTVRGISLESLAAEKEALDALAGWMILSFTGISHFSGTNNWAMMKRYIDGERTAVEGLRGIRRTAARMRDQILRRDLNSVAESLREEWELRKNLASGVSNEKIESIISAGAGAGALASKICGAGGGGCLLTLSPPDKRKDVSRALKEAGAGILDFEPDLSGLVVKA
jgi:D-glycero-alpha-D-manno-heptose-7-phosphate kinase